jgi:hypothetical protein
MTHEVARLARPGGQRGRREATAELPGVRLERRPRIAARYGVFHLLVTLLARALARTCFSSTVNGIDGSVMSNCSCARDVGEGDRAAGPAGAESLRDRRCQTRCVLALKAAAGLAVGIVRAIPKECARTERSMAACRAGGVAACCRASSVTAGDPIAGTTCDVGSPARHTRHGPKPMLLPWPASIDLGQQVPTHALDELGRTIRQHAHEAHPRGSFRLSMP